MEVDEGACTSQMPPPASQKRPTKRSSQQTMPVEAPAKKARRSRATDIQQDDDDEIESTLSASIYNSQTLIGSQSNAYSRSGKVSRIVLKNFMCHSNFAVDFNDHKNLMVGKNGSGKSAVLTALIMGLGSKASATSRCSSLKQLIKRGENSGSIEIHLFNFPNDGYEYEKYGASITVVRMVTATGSSRYKLKNAQGTVVSTSRDELMQMLMYLNIQVDNPVCVLNQDASRSFLRDSDPKKRFQLFMKATQIETVLEKLNACSIHVQNARVDLKYQKELAQTYENELHETQVRYDRLQSVTVLQQQVHKLKREQAWLYVIEQEEHCIQLQGQLDELEAKCTELRNAFSSKAAMEQKIQECLDAFVVQRDELRLAMRFDSDSFEAMRASMTQKQELHQELQRNKQKVETRQKRLLTDIAQLEMELLERSESHCTQVQREKDANDQKLLRLVEQKEELTAMSDSAKRDTDMLINTRSQEQDQFDELQQKRRNIRGQCDKIARNIQECDASGKDTLLVYGQYMPKLIAAVEALNKRGKFTAMPRGPLGRYVELDDDKWKMAVENILGNMVFAFAVNDVKDRKVLTELIKRDFPAHARHTIITSKFTNHVYDVKNGAVHPPTNTRLLMDVLCVNDPVVMNCLIDNCKVETILLTDDEQVVMRLTSDEENVPRKMARIVLIKPFSVFYPAPNYRSYSLNVRRAQYLQVDMTQRKDMLQEELEQLKHNLADLDQSMSNHTKRQEQTNRTLAEKHKQRSKLQQTLDTIRNDILELEAIEYPSENEVEILRKELVELQTSLEENTAIVDRENDRYETHTKLMAEKEKDLAELKAIVREKDAQIRDLQNQYDEKKRILDEDLVNVKYGEQKIRAAEQEITGAKKEYDLEVAKQKELTATAVEFGERIERRHNHQQIAAKLRKGGSRIATAASSGETVEQLAQKLDLQTKRFHYTTKLVTTLQETLQSLHSSRKTRYEGLSQLKTHMSLRIQFMFNNLLKLRGYSGELKINHTEQTLELSVVPRDKNVENAVSNAKSLSGGERSYTTIALLLSLWKCVDFPFYFLDEYDVFTDVVNRHYITKLLFSEADKHKHRQYTFLTPQDMSNVEAGDKLSIHRLAEPER